MKIGLMGVNVGQVCTTPGGITRVAQLAEELGYESLWVSEHMALPSPRTEASPMEPKDPILDPLAALAFAAAGTSRLLLGTAVVLLPQRNAVALAKEASTVDVLSRGRLILGVGVGKPGPELDVVGLAAPQRGRRSAEYVEAMRELWSAERPEFDREFVSFAAIDAYPRPVRGDIPIVRGGRTEAAFRHAVAACHGWVGFLLDLETTRTFVDTIGRVADTLERRSGLPPLEITVTPRKLEPGDIERFEDAGVHRLTLLVPQKLDLPALEDWLRRRAPRT